ncbi:2-phospho-L-lactate transferase [Natronomonas sp. F2-12]|jgi:LPPG:FO 2-phospho-L-lactate transferase|uniref:2-phospho-L-lactate transferase n=1 Tax=Natronomonas aquatica TaxID=2841590 RepID=A0A9R1D723_9EURY|nr:2-phospho-L-lactate transferase [Natronomonas aquatica]MCQ4332725.1 2-phospho-L-lactate transferase [Natronomonas aquatica]
MVTFLAGGTGTPKLLWGADGVFDPGETPVVCNTGDDVEMGGLLVCPDVDTVLFSEGGILDRETWWGIGGDSTETHGAIGELAEDAGLDPGPRYLSDDAQTSGREIARWRRFSGVAEFMELGDRDRAVHVTRTGLLDEGKTLTETTATLAEALGVDRPVLPMSDDPVATIVHTDEGPMHFQEFWVHRRAEPSVDRVEYRGADGAEPTSAVREALDAPVVIGPSNPVTSIGPMVAMDAVRAALESTPVVAVSPFVGDRIFSGPAGKLLEATGYEASTAGVAEAYPYADAFVLDTDDDTELDRPTVRTDTELGSPADGERVCRAVREALGTVGAEVV